MADGNMALSQLPLTIIVAATAKNGIGKSGGLPWPLLKKDMAYFARVTKRAPLHLPLPTTTGAGFVQSDTLKEPSAGPRRNVVIMGRKTWDSIPPKLRPLKGRTNIIISSQSRADLQPIPDEVVVASDIHAGLASLESLINEGKSSPVGRAYIIGGSSIYSSALELAQTTHILMTRVGRDYDCDTFFPVVLVESSNAASPWKRQSHAELQDFVGEEIENGPQLQTVGDEAVALDFQLYARVC